MSDELKPQSPRTAPRLRTLKGARILFNDGFSSFDATIRDISDTGVKLRLSTTFIVPQTFQLLILNTNTGVSETRACETRWQRGDLVGARFLESIPEVPATPRAATLRRAVPPA